jgi:hypothetical protein
MRQSEACGLRLGQRCECPMRQPNSFTLNGSTAVVCVDESQDARHARERYIASSPCPTIRGHNPAGTNQTLFAQGKDGAPFVDLMVKYKPRHR